MLNANVSVVYHDPESAAWFSQSLDALSRLYRFVSLDEVAEYYEGKRELKNACLVTFDDGWKSTYDIAYPVLKKKGIPAGLFVSPKHIRTGESYWFQAASGIQRKDFAEVAAPYFPQLSPDQLQQYNPKILLKTLRISRIQEILSQLPQNGAENKRWNVTVDELKELQSSGVFTMGAHTMNHPILQNESRESADYEITASVSELEELLGSKVKYFAYPNGMQDVDFSEREYEALERAQVSYAFSTAPKFFSRSDHQYAIPRINLAGDSSAKVLVKCGVMPYFHKPLARLRPSAEKQQRQKLLATGAKY